GRGFEKSRLLRDMDGGRIGFSAHFRRNGKRHSRRAYPRGSTEPCSPRHSSRMVSAVWISERSLGRHRGYGSNGSRNETGRYRYLCFLPTSGYQVLPACFLTDGKEDQLVG